ncbi:helix-turn-helix XRE-family transcriptional regulators [Candidatus Termititenax persephonae]|uniref:Helix-turn-helix XRE-family transcriptional regulators n=1 Tax=Candidatus Termititenax persephonae TaxID=2218525 RepID=A0A388TIT1_9BACT|nr:helix-turn-helix XRE-family transcriptional regulators [Candidatus Termititenax persephonae]
MNTKSSKLLLEQLDRKLNKSAPPPVGWIYAVRTALGMSRRQLGKRLKVSAQSIKDLEENEASGTVSLNRLKMAGQALGLQFNYSLRPMAGSLQKILEQAAQKTAKEIVERTSANMRLEQQGNSPERLKKAVRDKTAELIREIPAYLWE